MPHPLNFGSEPVVLRSHKLNPCRSEPDTILPSFHSDMYRVPTTAPMVIANEADPLTIAINAVLWSEMVKPTIHVALVNGYGHTR